MVKRLKLFILIVAFLIFGANNKTLLGAEYSKNNQTQLKTNASDEITANRKRFLKFKKMLLKSIPPEERTQMQQELTSLSNNKEFLEKLSPEIMRHIKNEVDNYNSGIKNADSRKHTNNTSNALKTNNAEKLKTNVKKDRNKRNISFDFPKVELEEFARFVAELNKKILIGANLLQGKITLETPEKISLNELMEIFEAILNGNGLSYMVSEDYMQIFQKSNSEARVYKINYLKASDVAKTLSEIFRMSFRVGGVPEKVMISSLDQANSLLILAPKEKHAEIAQAIKEIDFRRRQVLMEVRVIELTHNNEFGFGGTFAMKYKATSGGMAPDASSFSGKANGYAPPLGSSQPYSGVLYNNGQFMYDLEADQNISHLKILSQPKILTSENQKAHIKVGKQQPVVNAETAIGTSQNDKPIEKTTVDWKDIGVDLKITPRINSVRDVTLDLEMKITSIIRTTTVGSWTDYPVIGQRITKNSSTVRDNEMLFIGGILKDRKVTTKSSVPFFGDMPYIGWMFATTKETTEQTELIIIIIPRVIETPSDGTFVTENIKEDFLNYDKGNKKDLETMIEGKRGKFMDIFNLYNYFNDSEYRKEQPVVPQQWSEHN
ncbi:MAG: hypothetical protein K9L78_01480 [Victivallales bacterium]|nr:hypothetical protein [Victivallales bacterium]MCF7888767.1 hypothetical protein [Victivallales bacterium]